MKKTVIYIIIYILLVMRPGNLLAQTAAIPDPAFRQFLVSNYPFTMNAAQELILSNAAMVNGIFQCSGRNISSLEGIQHFTGIHTLYCFNNKLNTLPDLSKMNNLAEIHAYDNELTVLPSFNKLTNLKVLILGNNRLESFPAVDSLNNLRELYVYGNRLSSIPDLVHLTSLLQFHCYQNKISGMGVMPASLRDLVFNNNLLTQFPDISKATGLEHIAAHSNYFTAIPDLSSYGSLITCSLHKNLLTFEDLIASSSHPGFANWKIDPQNLLPVAREIRAVKDQSFTINIGIDPSLNDLTYSWYQNGVLKQQTTSPELTIPSVEADAGTYYCMVSSSDPAFSRLTLTTEPFAVLVLPDFTMEKELTITPDGDGKNDEFFFEEAGLLKVYDSKGNFLDQQQAPLYWNGSTNSGAELKTGFYLIRINNSLFRMTIIR